MEKPINDIYAVQNPALGAVVIWRFVCGYYSVDTSMVPFPLLFIVLPIIYNEELRDVIKSTRASSGLSKVSEKLIQKKINDSLYAINTVANELKLTSLQAIGIANDTKLISVDIPNAYVFPVMTTKAPEGRSIEVKTMYTTAERLGQWCAELPLAEICRRLKVRL